jgi:type II secretory pathway pseudopilin PulG
VTPRTVPETRGRRVAPPGRLASLSALKKSVAIVALAVLIALFGSMLETNRQVELHQLQSEVLQQQSSYAQQVSSLTNLSAPSVVVSQANALHLVNPTSVTQVPATSLDAILPLPNFSGYAPVTSRTQR